MKNNNRSLTHVLSKETIALEETIRVLPYDSKWAEDYLTITEYIQEDIPNIPLKFEHVGSTSIVGLPSKPVIDIDIIIEDRSDFFAIKHHLLKLGYDYLGDLGIPGREMFKFKRNDNLPNHHLYVCLDGILALKNHLLFRDYLRTHEATMMAYGELKMTLAEKYKDYKYKDAIDLYCNEKTHFILETLLKCEMSDEELMAIKRMNALD